MPVHLQTTYGDALAEKACLPQIFNQTLFKKQDDLSLASAWQDSRISSLLTRVITLGMFKQQPELAAEIIATLNKALDPKQDENKIWQEVGLLINKNTQGVTAFTQDEDTRINRRLEQIKALIPSTDSVIDVGCGTGALTNRLAELWNIDPQQVYGLEVANRITDFDNFQPLLLIDAHSLPMTPPAESALLLMVLHHMNYPEIFLQQIFNTLEPGGQLMVRETDACSDSDIAFQTILDRFYFKAIHSEAGVAIPGNYHSARYWIELIESFGFELEQLVYPEPDSPVRPFHALFRKQAT